MPRPPKTHELILTELARIGGQVDDIEALLADIAAGGTGADGAPATDWQLVHDATGEQRYVDVGKLVDVLVEETDPSPLYLVDATTQDGQTVTLGRDLGALAVESLLERIKVVDPPPAP